MGYASGRGCVSTAIDEMMRMPKTNGLTFRFTWSSPEADDQVVAMWGVVDAAADDSVGVPLHNVVLDAIRGTT